MKGLLLIRLLLRKLRISSFSLQKKKSTRTVFPLAPALAWPPVARVGRCVPEPMAICGRVACRSSLGVGVTYLCLNLLPAPVSVDTSK